MRFFIPIGTILGPIGVEKLLVILFLKLQSNLDYMTMKILI